MQSWSRAKVVKVTEETIVTKDLDGFEHTWDKKTGFPIPSPPLGHFRPAIVPWTEERALENERADLHQRLTVLTANQRPSCRAFWKSLTPEHAQRLKALLDDLGAPDGD